MNKTYISINNDLKEKINKVYHYLLPVEEIDSIMIKHGIKGIKYLWYSNMTKDTIQRDGGIIISISDCILDIKWDYSIETGIYTVTAKLI